MPIQADEQLRRNISQWGVVPIGAMPAQNASMVALGRALFFDKILSGNRDIACATCHQPTAALTDARALPVGTGAVVQGTTRTLGKGRDFVPRQSPSLLNSGIGLFYAFWDGRLTRGGPVGVFKVENGQPLPVNIDNILVAQALLPVLNRTEMRGNPGDVDVFGNANELAQFTDTQQAAVWEAIMKRLRAIPEYVDLFAAAFPLKTANALTYEDAARAIATFEMHAFTKTRTSFDRYLERDNSALNAQQKRGAALFFGEARCSNCHNGPFLGGQSFANVGVPQIGPGVARQLPLDLGRAELQNNDFYRFAFRVAPLRNVELTAPYMHNGAFATLEAVVNHYSDVPTSIRTYDPAQLAPEVRALLHNDLTTLNAIQSTLDGRLRVPMNLTDSQKADLVTFLKSLTDPAARELAG
jgi:cytochrome c peroxidase